MPFNELNEIIHFETTYVLYDNTIIGPNETANGIYRFVNRGVPFSEEPSIDEKCVIEVMLSAESFQAAIEELHHTYLVQTGVTYSVEFIGNDLRTKDSDPHLMEK